MSSTPFLAIVNPAAGGGRCGKRAAAAVDALRREGLSMDMVLTEGPGHGVELARRAYAEGRRHFVAVGGDGTTYEIVNGVFPEASSSADAVHLGFLPLGTGNSFLRDFSSQGAEYARASLLAAKSRPCDVVRLTHTEGELYFINLLSLGFVADVCALTNRRFKAFGEAGYGLGVVATLMGLTPKAIRWRGDGLEEARPMTFVSFCNSRFTGGKMMMAPNAATDDGAADVVVAGAMSRMSLLRTFPKIFSGAHTQHPAVWQGQVRSVSFEMQEPTDVMVDGEVVRVQPVRLEVLPGAIQVVA